MTALGDAFKKAGVSTGAAQLYANAVKVLQRHNGNAAHALGDFDKIITSSGDIRDALCLDYLQRVAEDMRSGHKPDAAGAVPRIGADQTHPGGPAARPKKGRGKGKEKDPIQDKSVHIDRYTVDQYSRRPPGAVAAARHAMLIGADAVYQARQIDGRALGDITWAEIGRLMAENTVKAGSYLWLGQEAVVDALILDKLSKYARVDDGEKTVRDIVPAETLTSIVDDAKREAPQYIEREMENYARSLRRGIEDGSPDVV